MTPDQIIYQRRVRVMEPARKTSVSEACRTFGVSRTTSYRWQRRVETGGVEALMPKGRRPPPMAGRLVGVGPMAMTGRMPNGQSFHLVPSHVWPVVDSTARLDGEDLGVPRPLPEQATIGDFRIPQRGILAVGVVDFESFDTARHSAAVVRPPPR